jgi:hypothetical protein
MIKINYMRKLFLIPLVLCCLATSTWAQWTKMSIAYNTRPTQFFEINGKILVADDYGLATSSDQGQHWQRTNTTNRLLRCQAIGNDLYAVTQDFDSFSNRAVVHSGDGGQTWDTIFTGYLDAVRELQKVGNFIYFLSRQGDNTILQSFNIATNQLTSVDTFTYFSTDFRFVYAMKSIGNKLFLATDWGLFRYSNGGSLIEKVYDDKVTMLSQRGDTLFSRTSFNFIYTLNQAQTWTVIPNLNNFYPGFPVQFHFINNVPWLVSRDDHNSCGEITLWQLNSALTSGTQKFKLKDGVCLSDFLVSSTGAFLMATDYYGILTQNIGETTWATNNTGLKSGDFQPYQVEDILYYGSISKDTGLTWFSPILGANYNGLNSIVKKDNIYFAAFNYNGLWKSSDLKNWLKLNDWVPHINKVGDYLITTNAIGEVMYSTDGINWTNTNNVLQQSHYPPNLISGGLIYALKLDSDLNKNTLHTSADLAATWQSKGLDFLDSNSEEVINFTISASTVYLQTIDLQTSINKVYGSYDFGHSWQSIPLPTNNLPQYNSMACNDDHLFVKYSNQIWVTANKGETWTELDVDSISGDIQFINVAFGKFWLSTFEGLWTRNLQDLNLGIYKGNVFNDLNSNGSRENGENGIPDIILKVSNRDWNVITDSLGNYEIHAELVNDSIRAIKPVTYCNIMPNVIAASTNHYDNNDFAVQLAANIKDISVTAVNSQIFRPGFETDVYVSIRNEGTIDQDNVQLFLSDFDDLSPIQFLSADPTPSLIVGDTLIWNNLNIPLFDQKEVKITFKTFPSATIWDFVSLQFKANKADDVQLADNVFQFFEPLFGSFDPNDKRVQPDTVSPAQLTSTNLNYTIRFQNTGNYPADFVTILDTLPIDLDISTLKVLAASHDFTWRIINGRVLEFKFNPIFLPDSLTNEPESHGFVQFSIRANEGLPLGKIIQNRAAIYFDYNPPVITDFSKMYVENVIITTHEMSKEKLLQIRPNPAFSNVFFEKTTDNVGHMSIYTATGQLIWEQKTISKTIVVQIDNWPQGLYFVKWNADGEKIIGRFVKG